MIEKISQQEHKKIAKAIYQGTFLPAIDAPQDNLKGSEEVVEGPYFQELVEPVPMKTRRRSRSLSALPSDVLDTLQTHEPEFHTIAKGGAKGFLYQSPPTYPVSTGITAKTPPRTTTTLTTTTNRSFNHLGTITNYNQLSNLLEIDKCK
eukprot:CAMPEP_0201501446 /NCGR_PEP_ID=MMETSP0151_2-20130828/83595_1 /ASSEMBLY_ACC=CAM_ASM_000257 /TAXON_ID=200890 /ORGANISM="Paramoeba atlantica, Strain 621/1 / CCAP 1560/9" /LENGTH=148 /DNA_ID=CAMNT_0047894953 /DNA_START=1256 /DNA_END=1699 /DNA_ORIENTATION=+